MDDFAESLWAAFAAESEEHLAALEPAIASAEADPPSAQAISQMFRDFHSLKGLSRGMGMTALEAVAHHAESVLGLVRDGVMTLSGGEVGVLLDAVDAIRSLRQLAVSERRDGEVPGPLVARLKALAETGAFRADRKPKAVSPAQSRLGLDDDMCNYFAELLRDDVGELGQRLVSLTTAPGASAAAGKERILDILGELHHAADAMELPALATLFRALSEVIKPGLDWPVFHLLIRLEELITAFEAETALDAGGGTFKSDMRDLLMGFAVAGRERLCEALGELHREPPALAEAAFSHFAAVADAAGDLAHALALFPDHLAGAQPAFLLQDVFARCSLGGFRLGEETIAAGLDLANVMGDEGEAARASARFLASALADMGGKAAPQASEFVRSVLRKSKAPEDLIAGLSPEAVAEAADLLAAGWDKVVVVEARLEDDPETAERFHAWLRSDVKMLTNRLVHADGGAWYRFLLLSRGNVEGIRQALARIDPQGGRRLVRLVSTPDMPALSEAPAVATREGTAIRVPSNVIDRFMAHIGELLLARSSIHLVLSEGGVDGVFGRLRKMADAVPRGLADEFRRDLDLMEENWRQLQRGDQGLQGVLKRLQESALELRVVPIDTVFSRFPRVVRDVAEKTGKQVRLALSGRDVRIDKGMVEQLVDPLTHMVRNAIDHGIEMPKERAASNKPPSGTISLTATQRGNRVLIEIGDDGRGLDRERIAAKGVASGLIQAADVPSMSDEQVFRLIFAPGFSTNEIVTEMSGRGVGMDVVNVNISRLGGRVSIRSSPGEGTTFSLSLPLSAAIQDVLLVEAGGQIIALPERYLVEICEVDEVGIQTVHGQRAMLLRNTHLPVAVLAELLGLPACNNAEGGTKPILVVGAGASRLGIEVDRVARRQELYVKDVHTRLLAVPGIGGASVLGDGRVVIILDVEGLFRLAATRRAAPQSLAAE